MQNRISKLAKVITGIISGRQSTICPFLWDSVFIDDTGDVYSCCHLLPSVLGNIYKNSLQDIWNKSIKLKFFRFVSKHNRLFCYYNCNIIGRQKTYTTVSHSYPRRVWLLLSEFCNISCKMCDQNHHSKKVLSTSILKERIDWEQIEEIELQGGEILALKDAKEFYLWLTATKMKKVNLITNGTLINDEWARHLVNGSNWVLISVNAASKQIHEQINRRSDFDKVINNISRLVSHKKLTNSQVKIMYKFTTTPENIHEIPISIKLANDLGCDEIAFGFSKFPNGWLKQNADLINTLRTEIRQIMGSTLSILIERTRLQMLGLI